MKYRIYTEGQVEEVKNLFESGKNKCQISRITNIPRATLTKWIHPTYTRLTDKPRKSYSPIIDFDEYFNSPEKRAAYSFTLAVYLCDGHISRYKTFRAPAIRMLNDSKYPKNTQEWAQKLQIVFPENNVNIHKRKSCNCNVVLLYSRKLLDLFPQYGEGVKHERKLTFLDWQKKIIREFPEEFIRGCIQSDGCVYEQKVGKYTYKRYSFTNMSEDIIDLLLWALSLVKVDKVKWKYPKYDKFVIQNFSKEQTAILEKIIPYKE